MTGKFSKNIILSMAQGFANTYLLYTACELDLFDIIGEAKEKISVQEIAEKSRSRSRYYSSSYATLGNIWISSRKKWHV